MNSAGRGDIHKFNIPVAGPAKYKGIDKNGKPALEINKYGKFASRRVKKLKTAFDRIDKFFHLKSKTVVNRRIKERKVQRELTKNRADILNNNALSPEEAVKRLYTLTNRSEEAGFKEGKLNKLIHQDVTTLLTHQINSATNIKDLKSAYEGFNENRSLMKNQMIDNLEKQINNRLERMINKLDGHLNSFSASTKDPIEHYALTRSKCELLKSILQFSETTKQPNSVNKHKDNLRKHMSKLINKDVKDIVSKLNRDENTENVEAIRATINFDFLNEDCQFDSFFRIGSNKPDDKTPESLKHIRDDIKRILGTVI
ncbi:hypothetical protein [Endozoicomonas sp.]|uniref:hypothetical protein n=1 Tax=Endozoicomonas sp. TaxID=1892382 RepID=UPI0028845CDB|nr:hypothetical protein [Endozoicomonas sp.]